MATGDIVAQGDWLFVENVKENYDKYLSPLASGVPEILITAADTLTLSNRHLIESVTAEYNCTLPPAVDSENGYVEVRASDNTTYEVHIVGDSGELINGLTTFDMAAYNTALFFCNGTEWTVIWTTVSSGGGGDLNIDGGSANSVYTAPQLVDGGGA
jgi:hypothetical protein